MQMRGHYYNKFQQSIFPFPSLIKTTTFQIDFTAERESITIHTAATFSADSDSESDRLSLESRWDAARYKERVVAGKRERKVKKKGKFRT